VEVHKDVQEPSEKQEVPSLIQEHIVKLFKILTKEDINIKNIVYKKDKLNNIVATYLQENTIPEEKNSEIISGLVEKLLS
jgi:5'-deoxynucleotidase YfbR-like HD superfamily hydrolase